MSYWSFSTWETCLKILEWPPSCRHRKEPSWSQPLLCSFKIIRSWGGCAESTAFLCKNLGKGYDFLHQKHPNPPESTWIHLNPPWFDVWIHLINPINKPTNPDSLAETPKKKNKVFSREGWLGMCMFVQQHQRKCMCIHAAKLFQASFRPTVDVTEPRKVGSPLTV